MLAKIFAYGIMGMESYPIEIEVDVSPGFPTTNIVGLADTSIRESKDRVKSAIKNSGFSWPEDRITVNLAPSDRKKEGASFDLAIALGVLAASGQINSSSLEGYCVLGELSLEGALRPIRGTLPISLALAKDNTRKIILPSENAHEAALAKGLQVFAVKSLRQAVAFLHEPNLLCPLDLKVDDLLKSQPGYTVDFCEVKGQFFAKRAIEVAIAGGHNILMIGPPGSGKTMLAKRIPSIMPELILEEALEVTKIHSIHGSLPKNQAIITTRPFRSPHHTISDIALVGGGSIPQPGEISLAHRGILFLDELPEFHRHCLETLRQPLEDGFIRVSRIQKSFNFPASFTLVCAMNPCPCGKLGENKHPCRCSTTEIARYRSKISGPLLDRIDIHIEVPAARYQELSSNISTENSAQIKERVNKARRIQRDRLFNEDILNNALMSHKLVRKFCVLGKEENELLKMAMTELNFSARAYDKILKVSRTIADLAASEQIKVEHLSEAIQYRSLDRELF